MNKKQRKISNLLVNPQFQMRYIFWITGTGFVLVSALNFVFYSFIKENYLSLVELSPMSDEVKKQLFTELNQLVIIIIIFSILFLIFASFVGLVFSHKAAGPIYHIQRVIKEISSGHLNARVHLRPQDEFQETAQDFNNLMDKILTENKNNS